MTGAESDQVTLAVSDTSPTMAVMLLVPSAVPENVKTACPSALVTAAPLAGTPPVTVKLTSTPAIGLLEPSRTVAVTLWGEPNATLLVPGDRSRVATSEIGARL